MSDILMLAVVTTTTTGTGAITCGGAYSSLFQTEVQAGAVDGRRYNCRVTEGADWMEASFVYAASGRTLTIEKVHKSLIGGTLGTTQMSLNGGAVVTFTPSAEDWWGLRDQRSVSGTSDTIANADHGALVIYSNASAIAVSIAQAGASGNFRKNWVTWVRNEGVGAVTVTPTTSTINGAASLPIATGLGAVIFSDGANYRAFVFANSRPLLASRNLADVGDASTARTSLGLGDIAVKNLSEDFVFGGKLSISSYGSAGGLTIGPNDASSNVAYVRVYGGSGAAGGSVLLLGKNGGINWFVGHASGVLGTGTSNDLNFYNNAVGTALTLSYADSSLKLGCTTQSTTTSDGALVVPGGVGIAKALNVGGAASITGNATFGGRVSLATYIDIASSAFQIGSEQALYGGSFSATKLVIYSGSGAFRLGGWALGAGTLKVDANGNISV